jgi:hypothetical protein
MMHSNETAIHNLTNPFFQFIGRNFSSFPYYLLHLSLSSDLLATVNGMVNGHS